MSYNSPVISFIIRTIFKQDVFKVIIKQFLSLFSEIVNFVASMFIFRLIVWTFTFEPLVLRRSLILEYFLISESYQGSSSFRTTINVYGIHFLTNFKKLFVNKLHASFTFPDNKQVQIYFKKNTCIIYCS